MASSVKISIDYVSYYACQICRLCVRGSQKRRGAREFTMVRSTLVSTIQTVPFESFIRPVLANNLITLCFTPCHSWPSFDDSALALRPLLLFKRLPHRFQENHDKWNSSNLLGLGLNGNSLRSLIANCNYLTLLALCHSRLSCVGTDS